MQDCFQFPHQEAGQSRNFGEHALRDAVTNGCLQVGCGAQRPAKKLLAVECLGNRVETVNRSAYSIVRFAERSVP